MKLETALTKATQNIKQCATKKNKEFTDNSLKNFKDKNKEAYETIINQDEDTEDIETAENWIRHIKILVEKINCETVTTIYNEDVDDLFNQSANKEKKERRRRRRKAKQNERLNQ